MSTRHLQNDNRELALPLEFFENSLRLGAPRDIGRPHPALLETFGDEFFVEDQKGDLVLHASEQGCAALGADFSAFAVATAQEKAQGKSVAAGFLLMDVLALASLGRRFGSVIDSGFLHALSDTDRARFVQCLEDALLPGGNYYLLAAYPEHECARHMNETELRRRFSGKWQVSTLRFAKLPAHDLEESMQATCAVLKYIG